MSKGYPHKGLTYLTRHPVSSSLLLLGRLFSITQDQWNSAKGRPTPDTDIL